MCRLVFCATSPLQVSAEEGSSEAETRTKKAITVVWRFVLFVEGALCGPLLMRPSKLVHNELVKQEKKGELGSPSHQRLLTFSLIGPQDEYGVTA